MKLNKIFSLAALIILTTVLTACQTQQDKDVLKSEILDFHKKFIDDHLTRNIDSFVKDYAEDYIFVAYGEINHPSKEEFKESFSNYLNSTTFSEYRDLDEPIIGFSKDGSLAWSIVRVKVAGSQNLEDGSQNDFDVTYAWITLYERQGDKWIRTVEVSTNN